MWHRIIGRWSLVTNVGAEVLSSCIIHYYLRSEMVVWRHLATLCLLLDIILNQLAVSWAAWWKTYRSTRVSRLLQLFPKFEQSTHLDLCRRVHLRQKRGRSLIEVLVRGTGVPLSPLLFPCQK